MSTSYNTDDDELAALCRLEIRRGRVMRTDRLCECGHIPRGQGMPRGDGMADHLGAAVTDAAAVELTGKQGIPHYKLLARFD